MVSHIKCQLAVILFLVLFLFLSTKQAVGQFTTVLDLPPDPNIGDRESAGSDTQINVSVAGEIGERFEAGATDGTTNNIEINIDGGMIGFGLNANHGSVVNLLNGTIRSDSDFFDPRRFLANGGSVVNIFGGTVGSNFQANDGSVVNIMGGSVAHEFRAFTGSTVSVSGGTLGRNFVATSGSAVNISGGAFGDEFGTDSSDVTISGGSFGNEFRLFQNGAVDFLGGQFLLNGQPIAGLDAVGNTLQFNLPDDSVLSGVFADGTPFAFTSYDNDAIGDGVLTLQRVALPAIGPAVVDVVGEITTPVSLRNGQTLNVTEGGVVPRHSNAAPGSTINVSGGLVWDNFEAVGARVGITGGDIHTLDAFHGSTVDISGGRVGYDLQAVGSVVNFSGGEGNRIHARDESIVNVTGGSPGLISATSGSQVIVSNSISSRVSAASGAVAYITGGNVGDIDALDGGVVNISGGTIGFSHFGVGVGARGTINISGGNIDGDFLTIEAGGSLNVTGGQFTGRFGSDGVMNISGGDFDEGFYIGAGGLINFAGGTIARQRDRFSQHFTVASGGAANISGGSLGDGFAALDGSTVSISGGAIGDGFNTHAGSSVTIAGGDFRVDGVPIAGLNAVGDILPFDLPDGALLTGTLTDGSSIILYAEDLDSIADGTLTLKRTALPEVGTTVINVPAEVAPIGLRRGQTLVVSDGGTLGRNFGALHNSTVHIAGGEVGDNFEAVSATVNITDGSVGNSLDAFRGTALTISGGAVGERLEAHAGSNVTISGGAVGERLTAHAHSIVNISGGTIGEIAKAQGGSIVNISGGYVDNYFTVESGAILNISGGTGMDRIDGHTGSVINITGGVIGNNGFGGDTSVGGTVNIAGGTVYNTVNAHSESVVNMTAGSVDSFSVRNDAVVNLYGGTLSRLNALGGVANVYGVELLQTITADNSSDVRLHAGNVGQIYARSGSNVEVTGGTIDYFNSRAGSAVDLSGGVFGDEFTAQSDSHVTITGGEFFLDGLPIVELATPGDTLQFNFISASVLSGTLADGSQFAFTNGLDGDAISNGTLTLQAAALPTLVTPVLLTSDPAPTGVRPGQTMTVNSGTALYDHVGVGVGGVLNISGGTVGENLEVVGGEVTMTAGSIGDDSDAFTGSVVNINGGTIGDRLHAHTGSMVNIAGGIVGEFAEARDGSVVNVSGGIVGQSMVARAGSTVVISGGNVGPNFRAAFNSTVTISGGNIGTGLRAQSSDVIISGGTFGDELSASNATRILGSDFRVDGVPIAGLDEIGESTTLNLFGTVSGILADGTPFVFAGTEGDSGSARFELSTTMPIGATEITVPIDPAPLGLRATQTLNLSEGGALADNFMAGEGSVVHINGGIVGKNFEVIGGEVNISGGSVGDGFDAFIGSTVNLTGGVIGNEGQAHTGATVNIAGGVVGERFEAQRDSAVNISDGTVGEGFEAYRDSVVYISGGSVGRRIDAQSGSSVTISGGTVGDDFDAEPGSTVRIVGGDFQLDGTPIAGLDNIGDTATVEIPAGTSFTGVLADGTPFVFSGLESDSFSSGTLTLEKGAVAPIGPATINVPTDTTPWGIRSGQAINVGEGGVVAANFAAGPGSTVNVTGGTVGENLEAHNALVTISGGTVGDYIDAYDGSTINISGGMVGEDMDVRGGSVVNISGGTVGRSVRVYDASVNITGGTIGSFASRDDSVVTISGGAVGDDALADSGSMILVTGGSIGNSFDIRGQSTVNISNGVVGEFLNVRGSGSTVTISGGAVGPELRVSDDATVNISGGQIGNEFHAFALAEVNLFGVDFVLDGVNLTSTLTLGNPLTITDRDVTLSGVFADGSPFSFDLMSQQGYETDYFSPDALLTITLVDLDLPGDFNADGVVDAADYTFWRDNLGSPDESAISFNGDGGGVGQSDYALWRSNYGATLASASSGSATVPEPSSVLIVTLGLAAIGLGIARTRRIPNEQRALPELTLTTAEVETPL